MLVKYHIGDIPGKGKGLIADEFIPKGKIVWELRDDNVIKFATRHEIETHPSYSDPEWKRVMLKNSFALGGIIVMPLDDLQYLNHSQTFNLRIQKVDTIALQDIHPGEEFNIDYLELEVLEWFEKMLEENGVDTSHGVDGYV
jgi:hypothetical protein